MLRAAGHEAYVALLHAGGNQRIDPDLPGLNAFNHAIVYMPGDSAIWIDPTSPYTTPGELPDSAQGRLALVISPETETLLETPSATSEENLNRQTTVIDLSASPQSKVVHLVEQRGTFAAATRQYYAETTRVDLEKAWKEFGESRYETEQLTSLEYSNADDYRRPFTLRGEFADAELGIVAVDRAIVPINPSAIFDELPFYLTYFEDEEDNDDGDDWLDRNTKSRQQPLQISPPHVEELVFRLVPPTGYTLAELPENFHEAFGPLMFSQTFEKGANESVTGTYRLDTGNGRLSPNEVRAFRQAILERMSSLVVDNLQVLVTWHHRAYQHYAAGRMKEAFAEYESLLRTQSRETVHSIGFVQTLLEVGLGDAARDIARRTVKKFPDNADAHGSLGFALLHDELGRLTKFGFDPEGSAQAYEKSLELDPTDETHRWNYAILLEHDRFGNRYSDKAQLERAAEQYRLLLEGDEFVENAAKNLSGCLFFLERYDELLELSSDQDVMPELRVAVRAIHEGVDAAKTLANRITDLTNDRQQLLLRAAVYLERARYYRKALGLYREGLRGKQQTLQTRVLMDVMNRIERVDEEFFEAEAPSYPVQRIFAEIIENGVNMEAIGAFTANTPKNSRELLAWDRAMRHSRTFSREQDIPNLRRRDALSLSKLEVPGNPDIGYRVRDTAPGEPTISFFVLPKESEEATHQVLLVGKNYEEIGRYALQLLEEGKTETAKQWLTWAAEELPRGGIFHPFSATSFAKLWLLTNQNDVEALRVAAATLAGTSQDADAAIAVLERSIPEEESAFRKLQMQRGLLAAYDTKGGYEKMLPIAEELAKKYPTFEEPRMVLASANFRMGFPEKAREIAREWFDKYPTSRRAVGILSALAALDGDHEQALELTRKWLDQQRDPKSQDYNEVAWKSLFVEPLPEDALEHARKARELAMGNETAILHTLATVLAERGEIREAHQTLVQSVEARPLDEMLNDDWYVVGRIAEQAGLHDVAREAYSRIEPQPLQPHATYELAQRRLRQMAGADAD